MGCGAVDGLDGRLLRQLDGRELLRHARVRVTRPHDALNVRRGAGGRVRFHRRVVQHAAAPFRTGLSVTVGIRTTPCKPCGRCPACGHPSGAHESVGSRAARGFHTAHREGSPYACHAVKPESVNLSTKSGQPQNDANHPRSRSCSTANRSPRSSPCVWGRPRRATRTGRCACWRAGSSSWGSSSRSATKPSGGR